MAETMVGMSVGELAVNWVASLVGSMVGKMAATLVAEWVESKD